jgi:hypothetical protein
MTDWCCDERCKVCRVGIPWDVAYDIDDEYSGMWMITPCRNVYRDVAYMFKDYVVYSSLSKHIDYRYYEEYDDEYDDDLYFDDIENEEDEVESDDTDSSSNE